MNGCVLCNEYTFDASSFNAQFFFPCSKCRHRLKESIKMKTSYFGFTFFL